MTRTGRLHLCQGLCVGLAALACAAARADVHTTVAALSGDPTTTGLRLDAFGDARLSQAGEVVYRARQSNEAASNDTCEGAIPIGIGVTTFSLQGAADTPFACSGNRRVWFAFDMPEGGGYSLRLVWADFGPVYLGRRLGSCGGTIGCQQTSLDFSNATPVRVYIQISGNGTGWQRGAIRLYRNTAGNPDGRRIGSESDALFHLDGSSWTQVLTEREPAPFDDTLSLAGLDGFAFANGRAVAAATVQAAPAYAGTRVALLGWDPGEAEEFPLLAIDDVPVTPPAPVVSGNVSICETGKAAWASADGMALHYGQEVVLAGQAVPGIADATFSLLEQPSQSRMGAVAFKARIAGEGVVLDTNNAVVIKDTGAGRVVAVRSGSPAPVAAPDVLIASLGPTPVVNDSGAIAIAATLSGPGVDATNDEVILNDRAGTLGVVVREGEPAWGIATGTAFGRIRQVVAMNNAGDIAFGAVLVGESVTPQNNTGIWVAGGNGQRRLVSREGHQAPNAPAGTVFASFSDPVLNNRGDVAFEATLTGPDVTIDNNRGIYTVAPNGYVSEIARSGASIEVAAGDARTARQVQLGTGRASDGAGSFNDSGSVLHRVWFTDRSEALLLSTVTCAADFDGSGVVAVPDIFRYLSAWFASHPSAEWDGVDGITAQDLFAFLNQWFGGC